MAGMSTSKDEYTQWLKAAITNQDDPNYQYLKHLSPYAGDPNLYGGTLRADVFGQTKGVNGAPGAGRDLSNVYSTMSGADAARMLTDLADKATPVNGMRGVTLDEWRARNADKLNNMDEQSIAREYWSDTFAPPVFSFGGTDTATKPENLVQMTPEEIAAAKAQNLQTLLDRDFGGMKLSDIDPNKRYVAQDTSDLFPGVAPNRFSTVLRTGDNGRLIEAAQGLDTSKLAGMETIRPGELDNAINGLKERLGANADKADWSQLIKYDPSVGLYTPNGAVKHVADEGRKSWDTYAMPVMSALTAAVTGGTSGAALGSQAGAAAGSAATAAGAGTAGSAVASTVASAVAKALLSSAITSAINGKKLNGKSLATGLLASGLGAGAGQLLASATGTAANGIPALLSSGAIRSLIMNHKIDPRLLAVNTAGAYADNQMGAPVYSLANKAYGAYNSMNRLQSNNGQARAPVRLQGRNGGLLRTGVRP